MNENTSLFRPVDRFESRHIGPNDEERRGMLKAVGVDLASTDSICYVPGDETIDALEAWTTLPDGTRIDVEPGSIRDRELLINGKAVLIRGMNRHDFDPATGRVVLGGRAGRSGLGPSARSSAAASTPSPAEATPPSASSEADAPADPAPVSAPPTSSTASVAPAATSADPAAVVAVWSSGVLASLKGLARAVIASARLLGERDGAVAIGVANEQTRLKCEQYRGELEAAVVKAVGGSVRIEFVVDRNSGDDDTAPSAPVPASAPRPSRASATVDVTPDEPLPPSAPPAPAEDDEADIDLDDLEDVPPEQVVTPTDRLLDAFPGSKLIEE